jgi:hypothetical protein
LVGKYEHIEMQLQEMLVGLRDIFRNMTDTMRMDLEKIAERLSPQMDELIG